MDIFDDVLGDLHSKLPHFNDYLLVGYPNEQVSKIPDYVSCVFKEAVKQFNGSLTYDTYEILSPNDRVKYSTGINSNSRKGYLSIARNECVLVRYKFKHTSGNILSIYQYVPYMYNNALVYEDTEYRLLNNIVERVISRSDDMIVIKVMRSPLMFWRKLRHRYVNTNGGIHYDSIVTCRIYFERKGEKKKSSASDNKKTPLLLYLLSRYGLEHVVSKLFDLTQNDFELVTKPDDDPGYEYFELNDNIYIKANKETVIQNVDNRRLVANLVYITQMHIDKNFGIGDLYDPTFYMIILGRNLRDANKNEALARSDVQSHMNSLATYIDAYTRKELENMNIPCKDIYELLLSVFMSIDNWIEKCSPNDLFSKRIAGVDFFLKDFVRAVYSKVYMINRTSRELSFEELSKSFTFDAKTLIRKIIYSSPSYLRQGSECYNDNEVMSHELNRSRRDSTSDNSNNGNKKQEISLIRAPEHRLHISMIAIESPLAISSSKPCSTGDMNPYAVIDSAGCFVTSKMPWIADLAELNTYLD